MSATGRSMNWSGVGFTPAAGSLNPINGVQSVAFDEGISTKKTSGDGAHYPTVSVNDYYDPSFSVEAEDVKSCLTIVSGVEGTFAATLEDARNAAGVGSLTFTMVNAKLEDRKVNGRHRDYGSCSLKFGSRSADGATTPCTVTYN